MPDHNLHIERSPVIQRRDMQVRIDDFDIGVKANVRRCNFFGTNDIQRKSFGFIGEQPGAQALQVQYNVGNIFPNSRDDREFVQHAIDTDFCHGNTGQAGEQNSPKRIAQRRPKALFQRLHNKFGIALVVTLLNAFYLRLFNFQH